MKYLPSLLLFLCICSNAFAQPSTGGNTGTGGMQQMYVNQISYGKNDKIKEKSDGPLIYYSNTKIVVPEYSGYNKKTGNPDNTYDTIDISGINFGNTSFTQLMKQHQDCPEVPLISCDSLKKLCKGIENIFWGEVFSTNTQFMSQAESGVGVKKIRSSHKNASLLITHGWIYDCKEQSENKRWKCQLFVQVMKGNSNNESAMFFSKSLGMERCKTKEEIEMQKRNKKS